MRQAIAYSTILGPVAAELRASAVPVIDDLALLHLIPPTSFTDSIFSTPPRPACAFRARPRFTRATAGRRGSRLHLTLASVRRYVAVSELTREYLATSGVPCDRIAVIPNFVDLERFPQRREASAGVKRALVYGNAWRSDTPGFLAIREACLRNQPEPSE